MLRRNVFFGELSRVKTQHLKGGSKVLCEADGKKMLGKDIGNKGDVDEGNRSV